MVMMKGENHDSSRRNRLIKMEIMEVGWKWFHLYTILKHGKLCLRLISFYISLKQRKTMLEINFHAPNIINWFEAHRSKLHFIHLCILLVTNWSGAQCLAPTSKYSNWLGNCMTASILSRRSQHNSFHQKWSPDEGEKACCSFS